MNNLKVENSEIILDYKNMTFWIVDDHEINHDIIEDWLTELWVNKNNIRFFNDWEDIIKCIEKEIWKNPDFKACDVIFMDFDMKNINWDIATKFILEKCSEYWTKSPHIVFNTSEPEKLKEKIWEKLIVKKIMIWEIEKILEKLNNVLKKNK
mgnify:CR=1 FL=1